MTTPASPSATVAVLFALFATTIFLGLWEVGWRFAALPAWFYAYALGAAFVGWLGMRLGRLDKPERPHRERVALRGFAWGIPLAAMLSGQRVLDGDFQQPELILIFLIVWSVMSLVYGSFSLRRASRGTQRI